MNGFYGMKINPQASRARPFALLPGSPSRSRETARNRKRSTGASGPMARHQSRSPLRSLVQALPADDRVWRRRHQNAPPPRASARRRRKSRDDLRSDDQPWQQDQRQGIEPPAISRGSIPRPALWEWPARRTRESCQPP